MIIESKNTHAVFQRIIDGKKDVRIKPGMNKCPDELRGDPGFERLLRTGYIRIVDEAGEVKEQWKPETKETAKKEIKKEEVKEETKEEVKEEIVKEEKAIKEHVNPFLKEEE